MGTRSKKEMDFYSKASVAADTGEIQTWDKSIFPRVIRKREAKWILDNLEKTNPNRVLDFGCGAGWLAVILSSNGYQVTGIDTSGLLIKHASGLPIENSRFVIADGLHLPFPKKAFDAVTGMAIFHHLDAEAAFRECYRVSTDNARLLLLEPNKLNPIAFCGRRLTSVQSEDEDPFLPWRLTRALTNSGWAITEIGYMFPYSFGLSYLAGKLPGSRILPGGICLMVEVTEKILERLPLLDRLCWVISVAAVKR